MPTREVADPDFWWHLRTGQFIFETGSVPHADIYSYTNLGRPWVTHEWLSELLIFALYRLGSFPALILTFSAIIALSFALLFARCPGKPYLAAFAVLLAALATAPTWGVRPQMLSLLLTSIFLQILDGYSRRQRDQSLDNRSPWLLIPLMLLWVNLHSGYAIGLALIGLYLLGDALENISSLATDIRDRRSPLFRLLIVFLLCVLVVPLNPNGAAMFIYPFETLGSQTMQAYIQEWFSPDLHLLEWQPFVWLLLGTVGTMALSRRRVRMPQLLSLLFFAYAGLRSARNIPMFALVAAPILAADIQDLLERRGWAFREQGIGQIARGTLLLNWTLLLVVLVGAGLRIGNVIGNQANAEQSQYPETAANFLQSHKISGRLYHEYRWGGYLVWRLYPEQRVFIDGRADVYGDAFIEEFLQAYRGGPGWRAPLERYGVQVVLVEPNAPIAFRLAEESGWQKLFADGQAVIFEKQ